MLKMTTYPPTLLIIVTATLLYPSTLVSEPWKKSKNQTKITYLPMPPPEPVSQHALFECLAHSDLLPSQQQSMHTPFKKAQVSSDPVLLISPVPHLYNITLTLIMLNSSSKYSVSSNLLNWKLALKITPSKQDRQYPANTYYMPSSNSTIIIPKSDVYRPC